MFFIKNIIGFIFIVFELWGLFIIIFNLVFLIIHIKNKKIKLIIKKLFFLFFGFILFNLRHIVFFFFGV